MPAKKQPQQQIEEEVEEVEESDDGDNSQYPVGINGYQLAVYKENTLKKVLPLDQDSTHYVVRKYIKEMTPGIQLKQIKSKKAGNGVQPVHAATTEKKKRKISTSKKDASAQAQTALLAAASSSSSQAVASPAPVKAKRPVTPEMLERLKKAREKRAANLAEKKQQQQGAATVAGGRVPYVPPHIQPRTPAPVSYQTLG